MTAPHRYGTVLCLALAAVLWPAAGSLASIDLAIHISNLSFKYDEGQNGSLFDAMSIAGGSGIYGQATRVSRIDFFLGGSIQGSLLSTDKPYVDFLIHGIHKIPVGGGVVTTTSTGPSFGFDLLCPTLGGRFLALDLDAVNVTYIRNADGPFVQFTFIAGGPSAAVVMQNLPFGLEIDEGQPITVRVSSVNISNLVEAGGYLTGFLAKGGTADVIGLQVPEPASFAVLLALGVAGLEIGAWKRRRRRQRWTGA